MKNQVRIKAILVGLVAGFFAGFIWSIIVAMLSLYLVPAASDANAFMTNPILVVLSLIGSFASSLVAGYVTARKAIGAEIYNSVAVGAVIILVNVALFFPTGLNHAPIWYNIPAFLLVVPLCFLGGLIVVRARDEKNS